MADQEKELIIKFRNVTGTDEEKAKFYLESCQWGLQSALSSFFENESDQNTRTILDEQSETSVDIPSDSKNNSQATAATSSFANINFNESIKTPNNMQKQSSNKPRIATLHNMSQRSSSDDEEGQAFYAGGSERSGQQVLGPPKRKNFREQLTEMFRMAHESGAVVDPSTQQPIPSSSRRSNFYQGIGLRLGQTENDHSVVNDGASKSERQNRPQNIEPVILKLWNQGFSINDGELRPYDNQQNIEFLETVMRGQIPNELREMGGMVSVDLEDHRHEDFKTPTTKPKTFKGSGHTLGSPAPNVEGTLSSPHNSSSLSSGAGSGNSNNEENEKKANEYLNLQDDQPTTMLQIRLADGSRISGRFNLTHTVNDIRQYIIISRPQYEFQNFILVTSFPTKELTENSQTIQDASLLNASIMQRLK